MQHQLGLIAGREAWRRAAVVAGMRICLRIFFSCTFYKTEGAVLRLSLPDYLMLCVHYPDFHHSAAAPTEHEDMPRERIVFQRVLDLRGLADEAATHIRNTGYDPDSGIGWERNHRTPLFISRISARRSSGVTGSKSLQHRLSGVIHSRVAHPRLVYARRDL